MFTKDIIIPLSEMAILLSLGVLVPGKFPINPSPKIGKESNGSESFLSIELFFLG